MQQSDFSIIYKTEGFAN